MKNIKLNMICFLCPIISAFSCNKDSGIVFVENELITKYNVSTLSFSQFVANNVSEYESFLHLIKNDSSSIILKEEFKPDFVNYSYIFSCEIIVNVKYNPNEELKNKCYDWYNKKYHILQFDVNQKEQKKTLNIYRIKKTDKEGFKEDCG